MLKRIIVAVIFVPLVVLDVVLAPAWAFALLVALITAFASWELLRAVAREFPMSLSIVTSAVAALIPFALYGEVSYGRTVAAALTMLLAFLLLAILFVYAILTYQREKQINYEDIFKSIFAGAVMPVLLSTLVLLRDLGAEGHGRMYALMTIALAFITDGGAYFAGVFLGKHRGITQVSPKKSLEGYVGGIVIGVVFTLVFGLVLQLAMKFEVHYPALIVYGLFGGLVTEVGDLAFSLIKREVNIKDYGHLLPGHGGMMDRFDSMVFCAPVVFILSVLLKAF